jgi:hypothetical protein
VQRQPDTRVHFVRSDGTVALLVFDKVEQVICWIESRDRRGDRGRRWSCRARLATERGPVYYSCAAPSTAHQALPGEVGASSPKRAAARSTSRPTLHHLQPGGELDDHGLGHLEGESVVVWDNGKCLSTTDGEIATFT